VLKLQSRWLPVIDKLIRMYTMKILLLALLCLFNTPLLQSQVTAPPENIDSIPYGNVGIGTTHPFSFKLEVAGNIGPESDSLRDLGSVLKRWAHLYVGTVKGAIHPTGFTRGGLVFADSSGMLIQNSGQLYWDNTIAGLGIGITAIPSGYRLAVSGGIIAEKLKLKLQAGGWPDYVFEPAYSIPAISELSAYIKKYKHLPDIPSAADMEKEGLDLTFICTKLLQKIEELTLYLVGLNNEMELIKKRFVN
jgi:hypothetical protein